MPARDQHLIAVVGRPAPGQSLVNILSGTGFRALVCPEPIQSGDTGKLLDLEPDMVLICAVAGDEARVRQIVHAVREDNGVRNAWICILCDPNVGISQLDAIRMQADEVYPLSHELLGDLPSVIARRLSGRPSHHGHIVKAGRFLLVPSKRRLLAVSLNITLGKLQFAVAEILAAWFPQVVGSRQIADQLRERFGGKLREPSEVHQLIRRVRKRVGEHKEGVGNIPDVGYFLTD